MSWGSKRSRAAASRRAASRRELAARALSSSGLFFLSYNAQPGWALRGAVREHLLLEVPMQLLCDDTCTGIEVPSEVSGPADLHAKSNGENGVDPRLAPLMKLVDKVSTEES